MDTEKKTGSPITPAEAKILKARYSDNTPEWEMRYVLFSKECYEQMFNEGAKGIRNYLARKEDGSLTLVLEGVDDLNNLTEGGITTFENGGGCPPPFPCQ